MLDVKTQEHDYNNLDNNCHLYFKCVNLGIKAIMQYEQTQILQGMSVFVIHLVFYSLKPWFFLLQYNMPILAQALAKHWM